VPRDALKPAIHNHIDILWVRSRTDAHRHDPPPRTPDPGTTAIRRRAADIARAIGCRHPAR
jgi:hypothetical protein